MSCSPISGHIDAKAAFCFYVGDQSGRLSFGPLSGDEKVECFSGRALIAARCTDVDLAGSIRGNVGQCSRNENVAVTTQDMTWKFRRRLAIDLTQDRGSLGRVELA